MTQNNDLSKYSGEQYYKRPPQLDLKEVRLNGEDGVFVIVTKENDEYKSSLLSNEIKGVILRVRRRLFSFKDKLSTAEHNHPGDVVPLFGAGDRGDSRDLREKYPSLRTEQVVYFLLDIDKHEKQVVRLKVKGASLGSKSKPKGSIPWYEYLGSFEGDDHNWQYKTVLRAIEEKSPLGTYYAISFERGTKLNKEESEQVDVEMKRIHEAVNAKDEYYKSSYKDKPQKPVEQKPEAEVPLDDNEVKPEEIF